MPNSLRFIHSVVLLTYKRSDLVAARLRELFNYYRNNPKVQIVVINNGSTDSRMRMELGHWIQEAMLSAGSGSFDFKVHHLPENIGFGGGMNNGVSRTYGEVIHLLSDDVRVFGDFIGRVDEDVDTFPDSIIAADVVNWKAGWNQFDETVISYGQGFYLAMMKTLWDELEGFDTRFHPYDYEDVDICYRTTEKGGYIYHKDLPLEHGAAGTIGYSDERFEHTVRMRALFAQKHGLPNIPERP